MGTPSHHESACSTEQTEESVIMQNTTPSLNPERSMDKLGTATQRDSTFREVPTKPIVIVVIGMAGTGKTSFIAALHEFLLQSSKAVYLINLDPAVLTVPYRPNIDIRDTIKYKDVMKEYKLGPNGAIMTSLNLFSTRIDKVLELLEKRASKLDYVLIDTPGQIEVFNWSASGTIILDSLAVSFPTVVAYIADTPRCQQPITFMSNMLYACSILYKCKLPFVLCFNKIDIANPAVCLEWMEDYEKYQVAVLQVETYMASLNSSLALVLNEFYKTIKTISVSSASSKGFDKMETILLKCALEYHTEYLPWLEQRREDVWQKRRKNEEEQLHKFHQDLDSSSAGKNQGEALKDTDIEPTLTGIANCESHLPSVNAKTNCAGLASSFSRMQM
ncbi:putative ATP binding protein [Cardiosporidium cionae]|uniref:GPN-loop GTPase n=1 Tax=Cardiosporidium cionae TaxID=476202 RepID=A0ABQ7JCK5_9APIC|nr:putative ATP binding protein [Cardiosporidium cionae]|eukprot:KAF8821737.1 putative ATP binding protein [Cardiosporidium cionae]